MSIELNQTINQKIASLNRLADEVNDLYMQMNNKTTELFSSGIYEGESAKEAEEQYGEFKKNFESYHRSIKSFADAFTQAKEEHERTEIEKKQKAAELSNMYNN